LIVAKLTNDAMQIMMLVVFSMHCKA
jgi:hypothetical protein